MGREKILFDLWILKSSPNISLSLFFKTNLSFNFRSLTHLSHTFLLISSFHSFICHIILPSMSLMRQWPFPKSSSLKRKCSHSPASSSSQVRIWDTHIPGWPPVQLFSLLLMWPFENSSFRRRLRNMRGSEGVLKREVSADFAVGKNQPFASLL